MTVQTPAPPRPATNARAGQFSDKTRAERRLGIKLAAPAAIVMLAVTAYPIGYALYLSLFRYDLRTPDQNEFVFLDNYALILSSEVFWRAVLSTTVITVFSVLLELVLGLALALVMHRALTLRRTVRVAILVPYGIITVISAYAFAFAVSPDTGFIGSSDPLGNQLGSFATIIGTEVWKTTPFMSLLLLAGLATVDESLQEAAKVDGASAWQRLWRVTLPNMKGAIMVALLFRALDAFRIFDTVYVQTQGALDTQTISGLGYNSLITRVNLGLGSAISIILFAFIILIAFVFVKLFKTNLGTVKGQQ